MKFKVINEKSEPSFKYYTDGTKTIKVYPGNEIPDGFTPGNHWNKSSWNKGLTKETDDRVRINTENTQNTRKEHGPYTAWNKGLTKETDERVAQYAVKLAGENNPMYGVSREAWNKGLTKETDERVKMASDHHKGVTAWNKGISVEGHPHSEETKQKLRDIHLDPEFKYNRYETMVKNGTLGVNSNTKAELNYYNNVLLAKYEPQDIIQQYMDKSRYPYKCDFYIIPEDKFIEIHSNWTHGGKPFNPEDPECIAKLNVWKEKAETSDYYKNAIYTWTILDPRKLKTAITNNLNFEIIY